MKKKPPYDHTTSDILRACGIDVNEHINRIYEMVQVAQMSSRLSEAVEFAEDQVRRHPRNAAFHLVQSFCNAQEVYSLVADISRHLQAQIEATAGGISPELSRAFQALLTDMDRIQTKMKVILLSTKQERVCIN